jgi:signal transduction histidine kinase
MIMRESGGKVDFVSEENKGSTFTLVIPGGKMKARKGEEKLAITKYEE